MAFEGEFSRLLLIAKLSSPILDRTLLELQQWPILYSNVRIRDLILTLIPPPPSEARVPSSKGLARSSPQIEAEQGLRNDKHQLRHRDTLSNAVGRPNQKRLVVRLDTAHVFLGDPSRLRWDVSFWSEAARVAEDVFVVTHGPVGASNHNTFREVFPVNRGSTGKYFARELAGSARRHAEIFVDARIQVDTRSQL
jgi:hypothetical protein